MNVQYKMNYVKNTAKDLKTDQQKECYNSIPKVFENTYKIKI